jgi:hypothetical protein
MDKRGKNDEECDNSCKIKPTVISYFPWDGVMRIKRMAQQLLLQLFQLDQDASTRDCFDSDSDNDERWMVDDRWKRDLTTLTPMERKTALLGNLLWNRHPNRRLCETQLVGTTIATDQILVRFWNSTYMHLLLGY